MPPLKSLAISARNTLFAQSRRRRLDELADQGTVPHFAAFYHRVSDSHPNGWTLSVDDFRRHLDLLQSRGTIVDLAEAQRRVRSGASDHCTFTVTFDDGYAENLDFAIPEMLQRNIPCTYFVTTQNFLKNTPFAHDVKAGVPLRVHTAKQIRELSDAGIEMGGHTRTHIDFSEVSDPSVIDDEIRYAKEELEQVIGRRVRYFAFPFGLKPQLTQSAIASVYRAGYDGFCSAYGAYNLIGRDDFHLRRFHGDPDFARFINWVSFDERKLRHEPSIRYTREPNASEQSNGSILSIATSVDPTTSIPLSHP